ncbi:glycoside hydrolase family 43 protein [Plebeiibacterium marinum]|uniref:Glycoside hydrolase family 43 protein n=1 Tax=Plebeiibacterium marinum TaxID=2992111 RepID=A0AAE3SIK0_9BACT|nr:glycoside hydrolase family 43 protein [Plebeiobacterium marinum]MCW3804474.1 glycoside hydrolase family 43 protein [Plebeiobacterium marinum]
MKNWRLVLIILCAVQFTAFAKKGISCEKKDNCVSTVNTPGQDGDSKEIFYADPTIYEKDGKYYLTGTRNREPLGFAVLESDDLKEWHSPSKNERHMILEKGNKTFGDNGFWAPQILEYNKMFLFAYTANEQVVLAKSKKLLGPYTQKTIEPIDGSQKNIDPYIFKDDDGKYYLYHVRFNHGNYLWVAEYDINTGKIKSETLKQCFGQTKAWEATDNYPSDPIMEGPTVIKLKNKYYMFYSANHFMNIDYSVGYATADSPYGPWEKSDNSPIIHRSIVGENGAGHGDVFKGKDGRLYYVYHVHFSKSQVSPRRTRIVPVEMKWDEKGSVYTFSVKGDNVIVPVTKSIE